MIITIEEVREAERQHRTSWEETFHITDVYLMSNQDRAEYIAWLNCQHGPADSETNNPY